MKQHRELLLVNSSEPLEQVLHKERMLENCNDLFLHILDSAFHWQQRKSLAVTAMSNMYPGWPMSPHPVKRFSKKYAICNDQNFQKQAKDLMSRNKSAPQRWLTRKIQSNPRTRLDSLELFVRLSFQPMRTLCSGMNET